MRPSLNAREVADLYLDASRELGRPDRVRPLSQDHADMAVFAARNNDGRTWDKLRQAWNAAHPDYSKDNTPNFARDCRNAYVQVTGTDLDWQNKPGRPPAKMTGDPE